MLLVSSQRVKCNGDLSKCLKDEKRAPWEDGTLAKGNLRTISVCAQMSIWWQWERERETERDI